MCKYIKKCPTCGSEMEYSELRYLKNSISRNSKCFHCKTFRICELCNEKITYSTIEACINAEKKKSLCKSCGIKRSCNKPERLLKMSQDRMGEKNPMFGKTGEQNYFYGKTHSLETKQKISISKKGISNHTPESKKKISDYQKENAPMKGRSVYSIWVEKYGVEIADQKMKDYKNLQSFNNTGEKNSMYGKPSPNGSGNGYSGWYNKRYFRSLRELMFLIYSKRFNLNLESLEIKSKGIPYTDHNNQVRNYFSDFLVNDKYFVEIKPKSLWSTPTNTLKFEAAKAYCLKHNLKFKLIDPIINSRLIKKIYDKGDIKFLEKYNEKFLEFHK